MPACGSPGLIAACHVLLRLLLPRHPPCALSSLTTKFTRHISKSLPQCLHCSLRLHIRLERLGILSSVSLLWNIEPGKTFVVADLLIARSEDRTPADPHSKKFITRLACIFTQSIQLSNIILGC